ncbi:MAG TPA: hypothetical protein VJ456_14855, partial [Acidimicrobiia bacterium]|nr:hypothetical protein [Acidimicrobiia bacterium]
TRRWVLDPAGAPAEFATAGTGQTLGNDPVADARDVFAYVDRAINEAVRVVEFNPESLEYRKDQDPFPRPAPTRPWATIRSPTPATSSPT